MTDAQKLEALVEHNIKNNGWVLQGLTDEGRRQYTDTGIVVDWLRGGRTAYDAVATLFDHSFARALFGDDEVDNNGSSLKTIQYWATQVAVKHLGKLYAVDDSKPYFVICDMPALTMTDLAAPEELVDCERTQYKLEKMAGSIPYETHRIKEVNVYADSLPAYLYHLQEAVILPTPSEQIDYMYNAVFGGGDE